MSSPQGFRNSSDAAAGSFIDGEHVTVLESDIRQWYVFDEQSTSSASVDVIVVNSGGRLHRSKDPLVEQTGKAFHSILTAQADDENTYIQGIRLSDGLNGFLLAGETDLNNMATQKPLGFPKFLPGTLDRVIERWFFTSASKGTDYGEGDILKELVVIVNNSVYSYWLNFTEESNVSIISPPDTGDYHELFDGTWTGGDGDELNIPIANDRKTVVLSHSAADAPLTVQVSLLDQQGATLGQLNTLSLAVGETVSQRLYSAGAASAIRISYAGTGATGNSAYKQTVLGFGDLPLDSKTISPTTTANQVEEALAADPAGRSVIIYNNEASADLHFLLSGDATVESPVIKAGDHFKIDKLITGKVTLFSTLSNHKVLVEVFQ